MQETEFDVVVVGSGAAGLVAALTANASGLRAAVIEKSAFFGGTSAMSGGGSWVPNAPAIHREGVQDDPAELAAYLERIAGDCVPEERRARYLESAPGMMAFLESASPHLDKAFFWGTVPDYKPQLGGASRGRGVWPKHLDRRTLGPEEALLRTPFSRLKGVPRGMWITGEDLHDIVGVRWKLFPPRAYLAVARLLWRLFRNRVLGERIAANGGALMTRLRLAVRDAGIPLLLNTPMRRLVTGEAGEVTGVEVVREGEELILHARHGVVLATGGFEHGEMRPRYQPVVGQGWSHGNPDNKGDGHLAAIAIGAAVDLMDESWWYPSILLPGGLFGMALERKMAGHFVVNSLGERFGDEAMDYNSFGSLIVKLHQSGVSHIPAYLIIDEWTWRHHIVCGQFPGRAMPVEWLKDGHVKKADTIEGLAVQIGVPPDALRRTTDRFNGFAREGKDHDFGRGENAYDRYNAGPDGKNPNLREVKNAPFYAFQVYPGDLGTKGGLVTDADARVLRQDGSVIPGLYAAGNVAASVMGRGYAGPGSTLGPAMTFGWVAACHIASRAKAAATLIEAAYSEM